MLLPLKLDQGKPLQQQLHDQLRDLIAQGKLPAGQRMPSTRALAEQYSVSRMTVLLTYERLTAAGLLHTMPSGGTFVGLHANGPPPSRPPHTAGAAHTPRPPVSELECPREIAEADPALFPATRWRALLRTAAGRFAAAGRDAEPHGAWTLQATLAKWLLGARGLDAAPEQIVVFGARSQALEMLAHLLLRPGSRVAIESPGDAMAESLWRVRGAVLLPVPVDSGGVQTPLLPGGPVALAHVTPSCQYPLGPVLSGARRRELLNWANESGAYIAEVDRVGDMRYDHERSHALMSEDHDERVLYVGDFTCALAPWVTTAFLVVPPHLSGAAQAARHIFDDGGSIELGVLAEFIEGSAYSRHLVQARRAYASRREALAQALRRHFGDFRPLGAPAGFTVAWPAPPRLGRLDRIVAEAEECGLQAATLPAQPALNNAASSRYLLMGFSRGTEEQIAARVAHLARRLRCREFHGPGDCCPRQSDCSYAHAAD